MLDQAGRRALLRGEPAANTLATDYASPLDRNGHGTHVASTAAGNNGVNATIGTRNFGAISGVAPGAVISVYKAMWNTPAGAGIRLPIQTLSRP